MDPGMLAVAKQADRYIVTEKEVTYRTARRHHTTSEVHVIDSPERVRDFMAGLFEQSPVEVLYALALSSANEFLGFLKLSQGTVDRAAVYPRSLLSFLLIETNATGIILAHNHPGGTAKASNEDIALTRRIETLLKDLEVRLLDHIIYAPGSLGRDSQWVSLRQEGLID
jgi:DNA repair protein RadC